jgi:hypothetical protein
MKKLIVFLAIICALVQLSPANAQKHKFYYYPGSNVYFDVAGKQFIYFNGSNWVTAKALPANIRPNQTQRVIVYHTGKNVWVGNATHVKKYRARKTRPGKARNT